MSQLLEARREAGPREETHCACVHTDGRECYVRRHGLTYWKRAADNGECECSCHDREEINDEEWTEWEERNL